MRIDQSIPQGEASKLIVFLEEDFNLSVTKIEKMATSKRALCNLESKSINHNHERNYSIVMDVKGIISSDDSLDDMVKVQFINGHQSQDMSEVADEM